MNGFNEVMNLIKVKNILIRLFISIVVVSGILPVTIGECQDNVTALTANRFVIAMNRPESDYAHKWCRLIYSEVFRRLEMKAELKYYPISRASLEAEKGEVDGEAVRIFEYQSAHPNLVRVEASVYSANILAYTINPSIPELNGWDSLKGKHYSIEYPRGSKICEDNLKRVVKKENLTNISEASLGLKKLIAGRTDLYIDGDIVTLALLTTQEFKTPIFDGSKVRIAGKMVSVPLYFYVHKKHKKLTLNIADIIEKMKFEGLIEEYRMHVDKEFGIIRY